jgi:hypothetical protein
MKKNEETQKNEESQTLLPGVELPASVAAEIVKLGEKKKAGRPLQGWTQTDVIAHDQMWRLGVKSPMALPLLHYMISHMVRKTTVFVASAKTLSTELGCSDRTIQQAVKVLKNYNFLQVLKSGNTNVYVINSKVAWRGARGLRHATFDATIHVSEVEQDASIEQLEEEAEKLIPVPDMSMFHSGTIEGEGGFSPDDDDDDNNGTDGSGPDGDSDDNFVVP